MSENKLTDFEIENDILVKYLGNQEIVIVPDSVSSIGEKAFMGCQKIKKVILPETIKEIGAQAFSRCANLEEINIPSEVQEIEPYTFCECKRLRNILLSAGLKVIGAYAFARCFSLKQLHIPSTVVVFARNAFLQCRKLFNVVYDNSYHILEYYEKRGFLRGLCYVRCTDGLWKHTYENHYDDSCEHCTFRLGCCLGKQECVKKAFSEVLGTLEPIQEKILRLSFGIECEKYTLEQIAEMLKNDGEKDFDYDGVERAKGHKKKGLRKLCHPSRSKKLRAVEIVATLFSCDETNYSELWRQIFCDSEDRGAIHREFLGAEQRNLERDRDNLAWLEKKRLCQAKITLDTTLSDCCFGESAYSVIEGEITIRELIEMEGFKVYREYVCDMDIFEEMVFVLAFYGFYFSDCTTMFRSNLHSYVKCVVRENIDGMTIEELDFSVRTFNCLKRSGINTIDDLLGKTEEEIIDIKYINQKCIEEIIKKLSNLGLKLKS